MMPSDGYIVCCDAQDVNDIKKVGTPARSIHFEPELSNTAPKPTAEYQILTFSKALSHDGLLQICSGPTTAIVETNQDYDIASAPRSLADVTANPFTINMSSVVAYSLDLASILIGRFECEFEMPDEVKAEN